MLEFDALLAVILALEAPPPPP
ncbi:hypothetical protein CP10139811_0002A, partial [Chlamydia ibidis]